MKKVESFIQQQPPSQQQLTMSLVENCVTTPNERMNYDGDKSINEKTDVKWPNKRKINKKEKNERLNAQIRHLVFPKSPLVVFSELFNDVPIHLFKYRFHNVKSYTVIFEIDGQMYSGNDISKIQAKQKACENFFRIMLKKKLRERSEKKENFPKDVEIEVRENFSISKPKGPPQEHIPWTHFASLAMYKLINQWDL